MTVSYIFEKDGVLFVKLLGDRNLTGWVKDDKGRYNQLKHENIVEWTHFKQEHPEWRPHPENRDKSEDVSKMEITELEVGDDVILRNEEGPPMMVVKTFLNDGEACREGYVWVGYWSEKQGRFFKEHLPEKLFEKIELHGRCP